MKNIIIAIAALAFTFAGYPAKAAGQAPGRNSNTETVVYDVNVTCNNCKAKLERRIPFERGVKDMEVDLDKKQVTVSFDKRKTNSEAIVEAIENLGYTCTVAEPEDE